MEISDKEARLIHGIMSSDSESDFENTKDFDDLYYSLKPPPMDYEEIKDKIILISREKVLKNDDEVIESDMMLITRKKKKKKNKVQNQLQKIGFESNVATKAKSMPAKLQNCGNKGTVQNKENNAGLSNQALKISTKKKNSQNKLQNQIIAQNKSGSTPNMTLPTKKQPISVPIKKSASDTNNKGKPQGQKVIIPASRSVSTPNLTGKKSKNPQGTVLPKVSTQTSKKKSKNLMSTQSQMDNSPITGTGAAKKAKNKIKDNTKNTTVCSTSKASKSAQNKQNEKPTPTSPQKSFFDTVIEKLKGIENQLDERICKSGLYESAIEAGPVINGKTETTQNSHIEQSGVTVNTKKNKFQNLSRKKKGRIANKGDSAKEDVKINEAKSAQKTKNDKTVSSTITNTSSIVNPPRKKKRKSKKKSKNKAKPEEETLRNSSVQNVPKAIDTKCSSMADTDVSVRSNSVVETGTDKNAPLKLLQMDLAEDRIEKITEQTTDVAVKALEEKRFQEKFQSFLCETNRILDTASSDITVLKNLVSELSYQETVDFLNLVSSQHNARHTERTVEDVTGQKLQHNSEAEASRGKNETVTSTIPENPSCKEESTPATKKPKNEAKTTKDRQTSVKPSKKKQPLKTNVDLQPVAKINPTNEQKDQSKMKKNLDVAMTEHNTAFAKNSTSFAVLENSTTGFKDFAAQHLYPCDQVDKVTGKQNKRNRKRKKNKKPSNPLDSSTALWHGLGILDSDTPEDVPELKEEKLNHAKNKVPRNSTSSNAVIFDSKDHENKMTQNSDLGTTSSDVVSGSKDQKVTDCFLKLDDSRNTEVETSRVDDLNFSSNVNSLVPVNNRSELILSWENRHGNYLMEFARYYASNNQFGAIVRYKPNECSLNQYRYYYMTKDFRRVIFDEMYQTSSFDRRLTWRNETDEHNSVIENAQLPKKLFEVGILLILSYLTKWAIDKVVMFLFHNVIYVFFLIIIGIFIKWYKM